MNGATRDADQVPAASAEHGRENRTLEPPSFVEFAQQLRSLLDTMLVPAAPSASDMNTPGSTSAPDRDASDLSENWQTSIERIEGKLDAAMQLFNSRFDALDSKTDAPDANRESRHPLVVLEQTILANELTTSNQLQPQRAAFIEGVVSGDTAACALAGQLLLFRSSPLERLPLILKDLGEAYYLWSPKEQEHEPDYLEEALACWINRKCFEMEIPNSVELVQLGDRVDTMRHTSDENGNQVVAVYGWVVARRGGERAFARARVAVR